MKQLKVLLASMFVFTAVIRTSEVGECGFRHRYDGIDVKYDIKNDAGRIIAQGEDCRATWPELQTAIKFALSTTQQRIDDIAKEQVETLRLRKAAKELVGAEVRGD